MSKKESSGPIGAPLIALGDDVRAMVGFSTRLPVRFAAPVMPRALRALPVAGLVVGAISAVPAVLASLAGLPALFAGLVAVAAAATITGALHEDGLADVADGFGGGGDKAAKLAIMRDSRIGTYGVTALVLGLAARAVLIAHIIGAAGDGAVIPALIAAAVLSRAGVVHLFAVLAPARGDGLGQTAGRPTTDQRNTALTLALAIAALAIAPVFGFVAVGLAIVLAILCTVLMVRLAERQIGGQTGDVGGATQQVCEVAVLTAIAAVV